MRRLTLVLGTAALTATVVAGAMAGQRDPARTARFVREVPWATTGTWVAADTHVHTRFSDGGNTVDEVLAKGAEFGCRAIAITDHGDRKLTAATPAYRSAIEAARASHPQMIIAAGLEWNVPPFDGEEHMTVLLPPAPGEWEALAQFKDRFDDFQLGSRPKPNAEAALRWLDMATGGERVRPVIVYNHPSRVDAASIVNVEDIASWRRINDLVIGFEGAPGHQGREPVGSYSSVERPIDRWDPVAARPGDAWDTLLQRGLDVTAALAGSDFHNQNPRDLNDYWPCQFAETWVKVPELTVGGLLEGLRAGTAFAEHGHIAREVELTLTAPGLPRPATVGEVITVPAETAVTAVLSLEVPDRDWQAQPNQIDAIEFIVVRPAKVEVIALPVTGTGRRSVSTSIVVGPAGAVVRARGRRRAEGADLMFYTNAIRVTVLRP